jgi:hypothetical protein
VWVGCRMDAGGSFVLVEELACIEAVGVVVEAGNILAFLEAGDNAVSCLE